MENELQKPSAHEVESIPGSVHSALTSLENVLSTIFKNIEKDTQNLSSETRLNLQNDGLKTKLERIGLLTRRIQREIN